MKKYLCLLLAAVTLLSGCQVLAEGDSIVDIDLPITNTLTKTLHAGLSDWFSSSKNRAFLTVIVVMDVAIALDIEMSDIFSLLQPSYVGKKNLYLVVATTNDENKSLVVLYNPLTGKAGYAIYDFSADFVELLMSGLCSEEYYKNDVNDLFEVLVDLQSLGE